MAYSIEKKGEKFCVYDDDNNSKGEFDSRAGAMKKMKELYAAEKSGKSEKKTPEKDDSDEDDE